MRGLPEPIAAGESKRDAHEQRKRQRPDGRTRRAERLGRPEADRMLETDGRLDPHLGIGAGVVSPELDRPVGRLARRCRIRRQENGWSHVVVRHDNRAAQREILAERFVRLIGLANLINLSDLSNLISPVTRFNDFNDPFCCGPGCFFLSLERQERSGRGQGGASGRQARPPWPFGDRRSQVEAEPNARPGAR